MVHIEGIVEDVLQQQVIEYSIWTSALMINHF